MLQPMPLFLALVLGASCLFTPGLEAAGSSAAASPFVTDEPDSRAKVDLNRASIEDLVTLPGVGEKVAARIVTYRDENGPFRELRELMNVRGIGEKTFLKLESLLTLSKPEPGKTGKD